MMKKVEIVDLKANILDDNEKQAEQLREYLKKEKLFLLNLMSSPGAGKTTPLLRTIEECKETLRLGIMEADIDSDVDAVKISEAGASAIQLHTGGMCHLDAVMTKQGIDHFDPKEFDLIILENVGNLVCPAEFDTGACKNVCIVSIPEGDDKPLKYPLMFEVADLVLVNKIDAADFFDFDLESFIQNVHMRHPGIPILPISAKSGEGIKAWTDWLQKEVTRWNCEP